MGISVVLSWLALALPAGAARPCSFDGTERATSSEAGPPRSVRFLTGVRVGAHRCFDRVVFEFEESGGRPPGYRLEYERPPIREDGSGRPVRVDGESFVVVRLTPARDTEISGGHTKRTYRGPDRMKVPGGTRIVEVRHVSSFEGTVKWAIGVDARRPFRAVTLTSPARVVVDVG